MLNAELDDRFEASTYGMLVVEDALNEFGCGVSGQPNVKYHASQSTIQNQPCCGTSRGSGLSDLPRHAVLYILFLVSASCFVNSALDSLKP